MTAVELQNISVSFDGQTQVLRELSLSVRFGEFVLLSGLSGEGKTTLLSVINGVIPFLNPAKMTGRVLLCGEDVTKQAVGKRARLVGSVLQNADEQIVNTRADDEAAFGCENLAMPLPQMQQAVATALSRMELPADAPTRTLSGGQKQKLITASTLAMGQKILLLDEPLANLDRQSALQLLRTLRGLCKNGYAVLLVEHRLDLALPFADTLYTMEDGKLFLQKDKAGFLKSQQALLPQTESCKQDRVLICAQGLRYSKKDKEILHGVDFEIRAGEKIVLLGDNGCGKTTLLRLLSRLEKPDCGIYSQTILPSCRRANAAWFRHVGYVYQNPSYQLCMPTLGQEIRSGAANDATAGQMLEQFGLSTFRDRHPHALSEGQKRRAGVAAICAAKPQVIFLDEPTVGQDLFHLRQMVDSLFTLQKETGCALVTVTHDVRCAAALADRIVWMERGRILRTGDRTLAARYFEERSADDGA